MHRLEAILGELHPETEFKRETRLVEDSHFDSLDIVTLVTDINDVYGIDIGAEDVIPENFATPQDIASLIRRRGGEICG